jgi:hypothetical protein
LGNAALEREISKALYCHGSPPDPDLTSHQCKNYSTNQ